MAQKLTASMPDSLDLDETYTIRFAAVDPSSGMAVSGVNIKLAQIHAAQLSDLPGVALSAGPFMYVPGPSS